MADLDGDLSRRLARLADAVPIGRLDPTHLRAVEARHRVRMAWMTPLVALVVVVIGATLISGRDDPGPTTGPSPSESEPSVSELPPGSGHVVGDRDGAFALELRAGKARYEVGEAIEVTATLRFDGPETSITFEHDDNGPIVFGIRERVFGEIGVGEINMLMGDRTTIVRGEPILESFQKGGGFDGEHPEIEKLRAWFEDPELHLPEGTWHISARASGSPVGSRDEAGLFSLSTEIEIVVDDPATEGHPSATQWADKPVYGGDDIGYMAFQVRSAHPTYVLGSPIEFDAYYWLAEGPPLAESPFIQEAEFSIVQVDPAATVVRTLEPGQRCAETRVGRGEERHVPIDSSNVVLIKAVSWPQLSADALERGVLDLPVGRWRITAVVRAEFGPCGNPDETWEVHASLEVDVLPRP